MLKWYTIRIRTQLGIYGEMYPFPSGVPSGFAFRNSFRLRGIYGYNNVLCGRKTLNNNSNEWLLLDVNPKTRFLGVQKLSRAPKLEKCLPNKIPEWFGYKTIDFFVNKHIVWLSSANWCFQKKHGLWTPFLTKCSECDVSFTKESHLAYLYLTKDGAYKVTLQCVEVHCVELRSTHLNCTALVQL